MTPQERLHVNNMKPEKRAAWERRVAELVESGVPLEDAEGRAVWDVGVDLVRREEKHIQLRRRYR